MSTLRVLGVGAKEAEVLAGLHGGPGQDDTAYPLAGERVDRSRHREIGLTGTGRADADDDVVLGDRPQVFALPSGLGLNDAAQSRQNDLHRIGGRSLVAELAVRLVGHQALYVVHVEILADAREVDQRLRHGSGPLDRGGWSGEGEAVAAQRDPHTQTARELEQIGS